MNLVALKQIIQSLDDDDFYEICSLLQREGIRRKPVVGTADIRDIEGELKDESAKDLESPKD